MLIRSEGEEEEGGREEEGLEDGDFAGGREDGKGLAFWKREMEEVFEGRREVGTGLERSSLLVDS